jgi:hypothetical protein
VLPTVDLLDAEREDYRLAHPLAGVMPLSRRLLIDDARARTPSSRSPTPIRGCRAIRRCAGGPRA